MKVNFLRILVGSDDDPMLVEGQGCDVDDGFVDCFEHGSSGSDFTKLLRKIGVRGDLLEIIEIENRDSNNDFHPLQFLETRIRTAALGCDDDGWIDAIFDRQLVPPFVFDTEVSSVIARMKFLDRAYDDVLPDGVHYSRGVRVVTMRKKSTAGCGGAGGAGGDWKGGVGGACGDGDGETGGCDGPFGFTNYPFEFNAEGWWFHGTCSSAADELAWQLEFNDDLPTKHQDFGTQSLYLTTCFESAMEHARRNRLGLDTAPGQRPAVVAFKLGRIEQLGAMDLSESDSMWKQVVLASRLCDTKLCRALPGTTQMDGTNLEQLLHKVDSHSFVFGPVAEQVVKVFRRAMAAQKVLKAKSACPPLAAITRQEFDEWAQLIRVCSRFPDQLAVHRSGSDYLNSVPCCIVRDTTDL